MRWGRNECCSLVVRTYREPLEFASEASAAEVVASSYIRRTNALARPGLEFWVEAMDLLGLNLNVQFDHWHYAQEAESCNKIIILRSLPPCW